MRRPYGASARRVHAHGRYFFRRDFFIRGTRETVTGAF